MFRQIGMEFSEPRSMWRCSRSVWRSCRVRVQTYYACISHRSYEICSENWYFEKCELSNFVTVKDIWNFEKSNRFCKPCSKMVLKFWTWNDLKNVNSWNVWTFQRFQMLKVVCFESSSNLKMYWNLWNFELSCYSFCIRNLRHKSSYFFRFREFCVRDHCVRYSFCSFP